ncbi:discoidin domain-containing protein [Sphingomonas sp. 1P06PA]|uniref:discoidin domain-containing protein n=1 Tax=Sphingomonas sp. 1P06PA TaxID=554121 RepID=UPI0039A578E7
MAHDAAIADHPPRPAARWLHRRLAGMSLLAAWLLAAAAPAPILLDGFENAAPWSARASDGVVARIGLALGDKGRALRLDYDFGQVSGYAYARRSLPITFPADYEISFRMRGRGGVNDLQFKLVDASGDTVWWYPQTNVRPTAEWQTVRIPRRKLSFAWGPVADAPLTRAAAIELVVVRGRDGGSGHVEIDSLRLTPRPPAAALPAPRASAPAIIDGDPQTFWTANGGQPATIDFGGVREFGGLVLDWTRPAPAYRIEASDDGRTWRLLRTVSDGNGGRDPIALPETATRWLRIMPDQPARLAEVAIKPLAWAATPNDFVRSIAAEAPRGTWPRGFSGEQSYWTLVGPDGGPDSGLIGEDGAIETGKGGYSIEPFIEIDGRRISWADVRPRQSLEQDYLPIPHVVWDGPDWQLDTSLFAERNRMIARYRVTNRAAVPRRLRLLLAVRPLQVNHPAQFLGQRGGVSPISALRWDGSALSVTTPPAIAGDAAVVRRLVPIDRPTGLALAGFDAGGALAAAIGPTTARAIDDPTGLGSAVMAYDLDLAAGESRMVPVILPFAGQPQAEAPSADVAAAHAAVAAEWRAKLDAVTIRVPPRHQHLADTVRTSLAHILMSREGAILKPGTRSYDRSWIRDGAMIADGLLRLGRTEDAIAYARWFAPYLFANGKVPCCVDRRGADPVPENDSHGQFIYLVTQIYRYTGDKALIAEFWPKLVAAHAYMEGLRQSERTAANLAAGRRMLYGLMPPSISHEGYSAKPQYSLWDDFWALRGYKDMAFLAAETGDAGADRYAEQRDAFQRDIHAAIAAAAVHWKIDYIPGATSLGDHDATSTTMALDPAGEQARLDPALLANTFELYWAKERARRAGTAAWKDYTPYELRNVSSFVRLGWRDRVQPLLDGFFGDRRPGAWNGWAEVVGRDPREIRFIGDMPHAWISSDYIRAALDMFAYERPDDRALVLAAGLAPDYLDGAGSGIAGLATAEGKLDLAIRADARRLIVDIGGTARPPGGFLLPWPLGGTPGRALIDGKAARFGVAGLAIPATGRPIHVEVLRQ